MKILSEKDAAQIVTTAPHTEDTEPETVKMGKDDLLEIADEVVIGDYVQDMHSNAAAASLTYCDKELLVEEAIIAVAEKGA